MSHLLLHVGCGPIHLKGWTNIDIESSHNPDVVCNYLHLDQYFDENSASSVLAIHTLEHIHFNQDVETALAQFLRVLKPGGVARIVVPDLMLVAQKYVAGGDLKEIFVGPGHYWLGEIDCPATRFAFFCRAWEHTVLFDERLLASMMRAAGFISVRRCAFGQSDTPALRGVDRFPEESLSMEGYKP